MNTSKKIIGGALGFFLLGVVVVALAGMYKFNYLANQPGYDVDGNLIGATDVSSEDGVSINATRTPTDYRDVT